MAPVHITDTATPLRALYNIFVQPTISKVPRHSTRRLLPPQPHQCISSRTFSTTVTRPAKPVKTAKRTTKFDEEITARRIQLIEIDPETNKLVEPQARSLVLRSFDRHTHRLVQVEADRPNDPDFIPKCKIIDKKEAYDADRKKKAQAKESKNVRAKEQSLKTLELNWAIDGNDLEHRMEKVRGFLEEGRKVEVVLASKKKGRKASEEECKGLLSKLEEVMAGVKGAKEARAFEGRLGGFGSLVLQGKAGAVVKETTQQEMKQAE